MPKHHSLLSLWRLEEIWAQLWAKYLSPICQFKLFDAPQKKVNFLQNNIYPKNVYDKKFRQDLMTDFYQVVECTCTDSLSCIPRPELRHNSC